MKRTYFGSFASLAIIALLVSAAPAFAQISLGTAQSYTVLAGSTVTNTGSTIINGNLGVSPGSAVSGFPPGIVTGGSIQIAGAAAGPQASLTSAYNTATTIPCGTNLTGQDLGLLAPLTPGVYCFDNSAQLTGTLTLNMLGDPNAFFLFKIGSTLTTASASNVLLINSGGSTCPVNVFWQVGSSATLGTTSHFAGNILALSSITLTTGSSLSGKALARNGAVTLDSNTLFLCAPVVTPPQPPGGQSGPGIPALDYAGLGILMALLSIAAVFTIGRIQH